MRADSCPESNKKHQSNSLKIIASEVKDEFLNTNQINKEKKIKGKNQSFSKLNVERNEITPIDNENPKIFNENHANKRKSLDNRFLQHFFIENDQDKESLYHSIIFNKSNFQKQKEENSKVSIPKKYYSEIRELSRKSYSEIEKILEDKIEVESQIEEIKKRNEKFMKIVETTNTREETLNKQELDAMKGYVHEKMKNTSNKSNSEELKFKGINTYPETHEKNSDQNNLSEEKSLEYIKFEDISIRQSHTSNNSNLFFYEEKSSKMNKKLDSLNNNLQVEALLYEKTKLQRENNTSKKQTTLGECAKPIRNFPTKQEKSMPNFIESSLVFKKSNMGDQFSKTEYIVQNQSLNNDSKNEKCNSESKSQSKLSMKIIKTAQTIEIVCDRNENRKSSYSLNKVSSEFFNSRVNSSEDECEKSFKIYSEKAKEFVQKQKKLPKNILKTPMKYLKIQESLKNSEKNEENINLLYEQIQRNNEKQKNLEEKLKQITENFESQFEYITSIVSMQNQYFQEILENNCENHKKYIENKEKEGCPEINNEFQQKQMEILMIMQENEKLLFSLFEKHRKKTIKVSKNQNHEENNKKSQERMIKTLNKFSPEKNNDNRKQMSKTITSEMRTKTEPEKTPEKSKKSSKKQKSLNIFRKNQKVKESNPSYPEKSNEFLFDCSKDQSKSFQKLLKPYHPPEDSFKNLEKSLKNGENLLKSLENPLKSSEIPLKSLEIPKIPEISPKFPLDFPLALPREQNKLQEIQEIELKNQRIFHKIQKIKEKREKISKEISKEIIGFGIEEGNINGKFYEREKYFEKIERFCKENTEKSDFLDNFDKNREKTVINRKVKTEHKDENENEMQNIIQFYLNQRETQKEFYNKIDNSEKFELSFESEKEEKEKNNERLNGSKSSQKTRNKNFLKVNKAKLAELQQKRKSEQKEFIEAQRKKMMRVSFWRNKLRISETSNCTYSNEKELQKETQSYKDEVFNEDISKSPQPLHYSSSSESEVLSSSSESEQNEIVYQQKMEEKYREILEKYEKTYAKEQSERKKSGEINGKSEQNQKDEEKLLKCEWGYFQDESVFEKINNEKQEIIEENDKGCSEIEPKDENFSIGDNTKEEEIVQSKKELKKIFNVPFTNLNLHEYKVIQKFMNYEQLSEQFPEFCEKYNEKYENIVFLELFHIKKSNDFVMKEEKEKIGETVLWNKSGKVSCNYISMDKMSDFLLGIVSTCKFVFENDEFCEKVEFYFDTQKLDSNISWLYFVEFEDKCKLYGEVYLNSKNSDLRKYILKRNIFPEIEKFTKENNSFNFDSILRIHNTYLKKKEGHFEINLNKEYICSTAIISELLRKKEKLYTKTNEKCGLKFEYQDILITSTLFSKKQLEIEFSHFETLNKEDTIEVMESLSEKFEIEKTDDPITSIRFHINGHLDNRSQRTIVEIGNRYENYVVFNPKEPIIKVKASNSNETGIFIKLLPKFKLLLLNAEEFLVLNGRDFNFSVSSYLKNYLKNIENFEKSLPEKIFLPEIQTKTEVYLEELSKELECSIFMQENIKIGFQKELKNSIKHIPTHKDFVVKKPLILAVLSSQIEKVIEGVPIFGEVIL